MDINTQWRVIHGVAAAVVVGGSALYGAVTGKSILKWRYKRPD